MRLWHKELLNVLPEAQLKGQWSELSSISSRIMERGTPNNGIVNRIMKYPMSHFKAYGLLVYLEMQSRYMYVNSDLLGKIRRINKDTDEVEFTDLFSEWHNDRYLNQCMINLEEKFDCGLIPNYDWNRLLTKVYNDNGFYRLK